jgi:hypothetical protein
VRRFVLFHGKRHPPDFGAGEAEAFLTHLAVDRLEPPVAAYAEPPLA